VLDYKVPSQEDVGAFMRSLTENAAVAAAPWINSNDKEGVDRAAVDVMDNMLSKNELFRCEVIIGEGTKDEAPMLEIGKFYGLEDVKIVDFGVDPVDGTSLVAAGKKGGISVAAISERGTMLPWPNIHYMKSIVVRPEAASVVDYDGPVKLDGDQTENLHLIAEHLGIRPRELFIAILDRPRNKEFIDAAHRVGANLDLLLAGNINPVLDERYDVVSGSGGTPEAVLVAGAVACLGGGMQAMYDPQNEPERARANSIEKMDGRIIHHGAMVGKGEVHFSLTAVTDYGESLRGCYLDENNVWLPGDTLYLSR
jgi:fructose-1,6-bisphosphatase II